MFLILFIQQKLIMGKGEAKTAIGRKGKQLEANFLFHIFMDFFLLLSPPAFLLCLLRHDTILLHELILLLFPSFYSFSP